MEPEIDWMGGIGQKKISPSGLGTQKKEVMEEARRKGKKVHFGNVMDLCHVKHSELAPEFHSYKGRVVFGGHRIHDEYGLAAEFDCQGSGASFLTVLPLLI